MEIFNFRVINYDNIKQIPISINNDPWEAYNDILEHNQLTLSNIEFTTTNLCICVAVIVQLVTLYKLKILSSSNGYHLSTFGRDT